MRLEALVDPGGSEQSGLQGEGEKLPMSMQRVNGLAVKMRTPLVENHGYRRMLPQLPLSLDVPQFALQSS
jgi:hypothetical protein